MAIQKLKQLNHTKIVAIEKLKKFDHTRTVVILLGTVLIAVVSFAVGMGVGMHKARFSYRWGENYERNFIGPPPPPGPMGMFPDFGGLGFRNGHGLAGSIISINNNNLVIKDRDGKENTVVVSDKTVIKKFRDDIGVGELKQGDQVVVVGNPDENGVINADIIRVFDNPDNFGNNNNRPIN
jgi:hypothetical protein